MFFIPAATVQPGQWLSGMFFQSFMCCLQRFFDAFAVKQLDRAFDKCIMQHVKMCIHKTRKKQASLQVCFFLTGDFLCFFICSDKGNFSIFDTDCFSNTACII